MTGKVESFYCEALPNFPRGFFIAQTDPQDTGGLSIKSFDLSRILERGKAPCRWNLGFS